MWRSLALPIAGAALLAGCAAEDETTLEPAQAPLGGELFRRYVALGNSFTAGMQSLGINDSTQALAYPSFIARQANAPFNTPDFRDPGCPPPLIGSLLVTQARVGGGTAGTCALRSTPAPRVLQNLAVPGANIADALSVTATGDVTDTFNRLQLFILGGRTMVQAMIDANPSFVSVALGNGDALGAALEANPQMLTPLDKFTADLEKIAAAVADSTDARDAVFLSVMNTNLLPFLQPGAYFFALRQAGRLPKPVNANCTPGLPTSGNLISFNVLLAPGVTEIDCADTAPFVLNSAEQLLLAQRVAQYNAEIRRVANARGFLYVDFNPALLDFLNNPQAIRKCQGLRTAVTPAQFQQAVVTTCPGPTAPNFFGAIFSFDAIHPATPGHQVVANLVIDAINAKHNAGIPRLTVSGI